MQDALRIDVTKEFGFDDSLQRTAEHLRVSRRTISRLQRRGLTEWQADEYAVRSGLHPGLVWEDWWRLGMATMAPSEAAQ